MRGTPVGMHRLYLNTVNPINADNAYFMIIKKNEVKGKKDIITAKNL